MAELVDIWEEAEDNIPQSIYTYYHLKMNITQPDSNRSDDEHVGNISHLARGDILSQPCEMVSLVTDDSDDDTDPQNSLPSYYPSN